MKEAVAILFGGESSEHDISCISASNVADMLDKERFEPVLVGITPDGKWWIFNGSTDMMRSGDWKNCPEYLTPAVLSPCKAHHGLIAFDKASGRYNIVRIDVVFPVLHGKNGEDGTMQGLLELSGVPYVGCHTCASAVGMDKEYTKIIAEKAGARVVPFVSAVNHPDLDINALVCECEERFGYPMFVKPSCAGSSVGITKAVDRANLLKGINIAFGEDSKVIIEPSITGREIEVAVMGNDYPVASHCGEIKPNSDFYDFDAKYVNGTAECTVPADISAETDRAITEHARLIYRALGCSGLARVDFFLCGDTEYFNEINTLPGFTPISMFPKMMEHKGVPYGELITKLIEYAKNYR